jgi:hypothetical protein|tara:strand:+ start:1689 stop:1934 length:246 start_codon:yes stop_codon:yes gene_type:complete
MAKIKDEQLEKLKEINNKFATLKINLGDLSIQEHEILKAIDNVKVDFKKLEEIIVKEYGDNKVVNLESGEITDKPEDGENK